MRKMTIPILIAVGLGLAFGFPAWAKFPEKEVKLIIPYKPGGGTDTIFRVVIRYAEKYLGQPIVPINMPGASASKGAIYVKEAKPTGYIILGHHDGIATVHYSGITDFSFEAFEPVCLLTKTPNILTVNAEAPFSTWKELVAYAEKHPGKLSLTFSPGSTSYYFFVNLFKVAGVDMDLFRQVPINGTGRQIRNLLGGHVDLVMGNIPSALEYVKDKKLRFIAVAHDHRLKQAPDVPTFRELGIDFVQATSRGVFAPKGTPPQVVATLAAAFRKACEEKELQEKIDQLGSILVYMPPKEFGEFLKKLDAFYARTIKQ